MKALSSATQAESITLNVHLARRWDASSTIAQTWCGLTVDNSAPAVTAAIARGGVTRIECPLCMAAQIVDGVHLEDLFRAMDGK